MTMLHICCGGPLRYISVGRKVYEFEMHPYCGPVLIKWNGESAKNQPMAFLEAVSQWAQQGEKVTSDGTCVYDNRIPIK